MVISYKWLKSFVPELNMPVEEAAKLLTDIGLEVEALEEFETVKGGLKGLVIGEVLECEKHPDADRLSVTKVKVDEAGTINQIVCGAPNVAKGQRVVVALPGCTVNPTEGEAFKIKLSKIRGVESAGMICAEDEIGLGKSHAGIMVLPNDAPVGMQAAAYFKVDTDHVIHIGLTPNRIDAASHFGVVRDLAAALHQRQQQKLNLVKPEIKTLNAGNNGSVKVEITSPSCDKYLGLFIDQVKIDESPAWLKDRLNAIGVRPINNVVDITNYVMHECGQPLHAFDAAKVKGKKILVRQAKQDEKFITLDGVERKLTDTDMVIANETEAMCLAGIFGGQDSGVSTTTTSIVLESAYFNPVAVRKSARKHELHTDSSFRFERGVDPEMTAWAMARAAFLIEEIAGGKAEQEYTAVIKSSLEPVTVQLSVQHFNAFAGDQLSTETIVSILTDLDFQIIEKNNETLTVKAPLYRVDVTRPIDVYEEILRIYGYNNVPIPAKVNASPEIIKGLDKEKLLESVADFLSAKGWNEIMNNSLNALHENQMLDATKENSVALLNPLSTELDVLRNSLLYGGLKSIAYNSNRQQNDLRFYELGNVYYKNGNEFQEEQFLGIWMTGKTLSEHWKTKAGKSDFYSMKGILEALLLRYTKTNTLQSAFEHPLLYDAVSWNIEKDSLAYLGSVNPEVLAKYDINQPVYFASVSIKAFMKAISRSSFKYREVSKFPAIRRDLSLLINDTVEFSAIETAVRKADKNLVKEVNVFDVYQGKNLEPGKRSYAISILIRDDQKTLTDVEVEKLMERVMKNITEATGAVLRG